MVYELCLAGVDSVSITLARAEIEDGSNDASGTDGAKRQRVGDASGRASGFEDGGGVRNGDELSADDLTQLAACDDVGLDLTEKESALLVAKRRACATRERQHGLSAMQGAQLHGFRLVRRDGQVTVECLLCQKQGFEAQSGRYFLNNYLNWHVGKDREHAQLAAAAREVLCSVSSAGAAKPFEAAAKPCEAPEPHEAAEPPVNATPHVSVNATGERDTADQGLRGDIRFPDWPAVLRELLLDSKTFVRFNPEKAGDSSLLHDVRLMAMVFLRNTHVVAVHRDEAPDGRITFRKYDNDSDARRRGTFQTVSARQLWVGSCEMVAITQRGSALHRAVGDLRPMGSLREQRVAELRAVLGGFGGLGALLPLLESAQIRSLSILKQLSVEELRMKLNEVVGGSLLSVAYLDRLQVLGLCKA